MRFAVPVSKCRSFSPDARLGGGASGGITVPTALIGQRPDGKGYEKMTVHTLSTQDVSIEFPGVRALSNVDFSTESGKIRAVVGANGAGKSTLMKVLTGVYTHFTGQVLMDGEPVHIDSPRAAQRLGLQIVHQEVDSALVPSLSVAENIMLNQLVTGMDDKQFINWHAMRRDAERQLARLNIKIDVKKQVRELSLAQKQMVLITRSLVLNSKFLILDEPTAPLSTTEVDELFRIVKDLSVKEGVGVIFVSHRLPEVFALCEDITIMRDTKIVYTGKTADTTIVEVVENMLGREFGDAFPKYHIPPGETLLEVKGLTSRENEIEDITMHVRRGEIIGIAGLVGAGKSELCKTLFSEIKRKSGTITLAGKRLKSRTPHGAVRSGIALVPEERRKEGILLMEPIYTNLSIARLEKFCNRFGFVRKMLERLNARQLIDKLSVRTPNELQHVGLLSGGNQQKIVVGKWIAAEAEVYIFDEATKGVDVGAKQDIFRLIGEVAQQGKGVIYATCETNEILGLTDRVYVMYNHRIVKELVTKETNEKEILTLATGGGKNA